MFINKEKFNLINGFDENFFLFFEENDFCKRGKKKGMKIYQLNDISVIHKTGSSVEYKNKKEGNKLILLRNWHFIWSKFYYIKKHYSFLIAIIYFVPIYARIIFRIFINSLQKNHFKKEKFLVRFDALNNAIKGQKSLRRI